MGRFDIQAWTRSFWAKKSEILEISRLINLKINIDKPNLEFFLIYLQIYFWTSIKNLLQSRLTRINIHKLNFLLTKARAYKRPPYMCTDEILKRQLVNCFFECIIFWKTRLQSTEIGFSSDRKLPWSIWPQGQAQLRT